MTSFSAQIAAEVAKIKNGLEAVVRQSADDVLRDANRPVAAGGSLPVDTGFLRNSLVVELNAEPQGQIGPHAGPAAGPSFELKLAEFDLGDTIMARWTAEYAARMEYGFYGVDSAGRRVKQQGFGFVRQAAQRWQMIVQSNAQTLLRINGR